MRSQKDLKSMKMGVNWIDNQVEHLYKMLKNCEIIVWWKNLPILGPSMSGTKCEDKPIFSAERAGQPDHDQVFIK